MPDPLLLVAHCEVGVEGDVDLLLHFTEGVRSNLSSEHSRKLGLTHLLQKWLHLPRVFHHFGCIGAVEEVNLGVCWNIFIQSFKMLRKKYNLKSRKVYLIDISLVELVRYNFGISSTKENDQSNGEGKVGGRAHLAYQGWTVQQVRECYLSQQLVLHEYY